MKRTISALLALLLMFSLCTAAFAGDEAAEEAEDSARISEAEAAAMASGEELLALLASFDPFDTSAYTPIMQTSPDNDMRTDLQYSYVMDDYNNIFAYAHGVELLSQPRGVICDFSADDIGEADSYIIQRASSEDFTDAVTVEGLTEKSYAFQNLLLGERFYWRGGTSLDTIGDSPVHEMTVTDIPPRVCYADDVQNIRDVGGYESYLVPGAKLRQGLYYRGATLNYITKAGQAQMWDELGVRVEIDMRDESWCEGPYIDGVDYYVLSIPSFTDDQRFEEFSDVYRQVFELIANADEKPVYLHCNSGADRTGIVTFMLLTLCGVDYDDIARDYLFSNFTDQRSRELTSEFNNWWAKLDYFEGDTKADQAKNWLRLKGVSEADIEHIREIFVEGYVSTYVPEE